MFSRRAFTASRRNYRFYPVYFLFVFFFLLTVGSLRASASLADICNLSVSLAGSANHTMSVFYDVYDCFKLQALVYDILLSTTAVFSYAIGPRKLSVNEQFFVGAQTVVSLLQTTQIKQGMSFIAANKVYTSANKKHTIV